MSSEIKNFGIIGNPVAHSLSPKMYRAAFEAAGHRNYEYILLPIFRENLKESVTSLKNLNFSGFNVTVPYKQIITEYLDELDTAARIIGSVNTVVNKAGRLKGYNTDVTGFLESLDEIRFVIKNKRATVLGAGGAARAIIYGLFQRDISVITIGARNVEKAKDLAKAFEDYGTILGLGWNDKKFFEKLNETDILINTTPLGMYPYTKDIPPIDLRLLPNHTLIYDVIYIPAETEFLRVARELGRKTLNGLSMLLFQGKEAYRLYTGESPNLKIMLEVLKKELYG